MLLLSTDDMNIYIEFMHTNKDKGLETLLDLNGVVIDQEKGYWVKFEIYKTDITKERPHGLSYSLTLHEKYGKRIMGYDNAHAYKITQKNINILVVSSSMTTTIVIIWIVVFPINLKIHINCFKISSRKLMQS